MVQTLSAQDVERLLQEPRPDVRAGTASKVADAFAAGFMSDEESQIARDIFDRLARDTEVAVRAALAESLMSAPNLPRQTALLLAKDVEQVALPFLTVTEVLNDEDLIALVETQSAAKQAAIAERRHVSEAVSDAIVHCGNEVAVAKLVANEGAEISERSFEHVMVNYNGSALVDESLCRRVALPPTVKEKLVAAFTAKLEGYLRTRHDFPVDDLSTLVSQIRERATVEVIGHNTVEETERLAQDLLNSGRMTPSLILRALCTGDLLLFEVATALRAKVPLQNARILIHDAGGRGLEAVCQRASWPKHYLPAIRAALAVLKETDYDAGRNDRQRFVERVIERMLTGFDAGEEVLPEADVSYLCEKLQTFAA